MAVSIIALLSEFKRVAIWHVVVCGLQIYRFTMNLKRTTIPEFTMFPPFDILRVLSLIFFDLPFFNA
jgi:hypothetical protein